VPLLMCDLDDTLVVRAPLFRRWAEDFLREQGQPASLLDWLVEQDRGGHRPRSEFAAALVERLGLEVHVEELAAEHDARMGNSYRLTEGTRAALDEARAAGWSFAILTNGPVVAQTRKIRAAGLDELADAVCISEEVGHSKPHRAMFDRAAERAGTTLQGAWMIGDNLDADIAGAHGVGARSVWVKNEHEWLTFESGTEPDLVASDFADAVRQVLAATR
jgi:putative hydrolase of the HAD superfamily